MHRRCASFQKRKALLSKCFSVFGCGGGTWTSRPPGYEPDELPTALPRDIKFCTTFGAGDRGRTGTGVEFPRDFKSRASANSATPAFLAAHILYYNTFSLSILFCNYYFLSPLILSHSHSIQLYAIISHLFTFFKNSIPHKKQARKKRTCSSLYIFHFRAKIIPFELL